MSSRSEKDRQLYQHLGLDVFIIGFKKRFLRKCYVRSPAASSDADDLISCTVKFLESLLESSRDVGAWILIQERDGNCKI